MNKYTGVLGVYNCQGAAWNSVERKNTFHETISGALTGAIKGRDVHLIAEAATDSEWNGDCAVYLHRTSEVTILPYNSALPVSLEVLGHDMFTVTPIKVLAPEFSFAPFGLIDMYNAGGAIEGLKYELKGGARLSELDEDIGVSDARVGKICMDVKGCGKFGAYSSARPRRCIVDSNVVEFVYDSSAGLVTFGLDSLPEEGKLHAVEVEL